jgi:molybdate transport system regulatory protein
MSIRNQLQGTITDVTVGEAMATVKVRLAGGQDLTAAITVDAVNELGLSVGGAVTALVKSTDVALATNYVGGLSIRNRLPGSVTGIATGAAMATVKVSVDGGELTAAITAESAAELGLKQDSAVTALIKSTEVSLATA